MIFEIGNLAAGASANGAFATPFGLGIVAASTTAPNRMEAPKGSHEAAVPTCDGTNRPQGAPRLALRRRVWNRDIAEAGRDTHTASARDEPWSDIDPVSTFAPREKPRGSLRSAGPRSRPLTSCSAAAARLGVRKDGQLELLDPKEPTLTPEDSERLLRDICPRPTGGSSRKSAR